MKRLIELRDEMYTSARELAAKLSAKHGGSSKFNMSSVIRNAVLLGLKDEASLEANILAEDYHRGPPRLARAETREENDYIFDCVLAAPNKYLSKRQISDLLEEYRTKKSAQARQPPTKRGRLTAKK